MSWTFHWYNSDVRSGALAAGFHLLFGEHAAVLRGCACWNPALAMTLPNSDWFPLYIDVLREYMENPDWSPDRVAKDGCGMPTTSNTVNELAIMFANLASRKDEDWIWEAMNRTQI